MQKKLYIYICIVLLIATGCIIYNFIKPIETVYEEGSIITADTDYINRNLGLYTSTISEEDDTIDLYPARVMVRNMKSLADKLPAAGLELLELYLDQYFNYYDEGGSNYYADVVQGSFKENANWPRFKIIVHMDDKDMYVDCIYWTTEQIYDFTSNLD